MLDVAEGGRQVAIGLRHASARLVEQPWLLVVFGSTTDRRAFAEEDRHVGKHG